MTKKMPQISSHARGLINNQPNFIGVASIPRQIQPSFEDQTLTLFEPIEPPWPPQMIIATPPDSVELTDSVIPTTEAYIEEEEEPLLPEETDAVSDKKPTAKPAVLSHQQQLKVNQTLHEAKVSTAWMTALPVLGPIVSLALYNPKKQAENQRADMTQQQAFIQETQVKKAKWKSLLVTAVPQLASLGMIVVHQSTIEKLLEKANIKLTNTQAVEHYLANTTDANIKNSHTVLGVALFIGAASFLAPLGYKLFEKPEDSNFNKGL